MQCNIKMPLRFYRHGVAEGEMVIRETKLCFDQPDSFSCSPNILTELNVKLQRNGEVAYPETDAVNYCKLYFSAQRYR